MIRFKQDYYESDGDIVESRKKLITNWEPKREVWALRYGAALTAGIAAINGIVINSIFRRKLKLRYHGLKFSMIFLSTGSAMLAYVSHETYVTEKIVLFHHKCLPCLELKAIAIQEANSLLYSLITTPAVNLAIAGTIGYRIPHIFELKEVWKLFWSVIRPEGRTLLILFLCNMFVAGIATYSEYTAMEKVTDIIFKIQNYLENEKAKNRLEIFE
ncbi:hypothetical protein E2986_00883 [Frieseomelitta varia]|uniref:Uncharacterized protein n=1 Tax=Frieseomelitta varia TaxID=561572 RepID=A0A833RSJ5_9HYME|nr:uncharacterized protein LOC122536425 [Frieseomelitta varia]KAF3421671.1 hypothetical protein E2986_00883 [Frieseomelitta varia]